LDIDKVKEYCDGRDGIYIKEEETEANGHKIKLLTLFAPNNNKPTWIGDNNDLIVYIQGNFVTRRVKSEHYFFGSDKIIMFANDVDGYLNPCLDTGKMVLMLHNNRNKFLEAIKKFQNLFSLSPCPCEVLAIPIKGAYHHIFQQGHSGERLDHLECPGDAALADGVARFTDDLLAFVENVSGRGRINSRKNVKESCLARPIRAHHSERFPLVEKEINTVEGGTHLSGFKSALTRAANDYIVCDQDVAMTLRDGTVIYCDIYRPAHATEKIPCIVSWSYFGKRPVLLALAYFNCPMLCPMVLEGMVIGAYAIGATQGYIYCRAEKPLAIVRLRIALKQAAEYGLVGDNVLGSGFNFPIEVREGAGAFVCGEETALMQSIEGMRGMPRSRPPFPAVAHVIDHLLDQKDPRQLGGTLRPIHPISHSPFMERDSVFPQPLDRIRTLFDKGV
jgi:hypothetical protein